MIAGLVERVAARPVTGRTVLFVLIGFFGAVMVVNAVMIQAAISTFGGVDTPSSYKAGLQFGEDAAAAAAQRARGWTVAGDFTSDGDRRTLTVHVDDATGNAVRDVTPVITLVHLVDSRRDLPISTDEVAAGTYVGTVTAPPGQWRLDIRVRQDDAEVFRSRNRVILR